MNERRDAFARRMDNCRDELKWLYCELYHGDMEAFDYFCRMLRRCWRERKGALRALDHERERRPEWYRESGLLGMMMYTDAFAGNLPGVKAALPYIRECGVNYLHLMPLLDSPKGKSDGGYAVSDFRKVRPDLGTMDDLEALADECRASGVCLCLDFVMNHTSEEHAWARAARAGDPTARARYFFYDNWGIPDQYERTVPQVFPTTAPGSFTWLDDCKQVVMTSFYPYQWDLNYANPMVFNDMTENLLYLANRGVDVIRLDAVPYIWKELGTSCRNLPQVHTLSRMLRLACQIVCPGVLLLGEVVMEPVKVAPYFGTVEKPECHMLYNVTTMCTTWHALATRDVRLLKRQLEQLGALPGSYTFLNYLRCHDDIGWGLDYEWLARFGVEEVAHKRFLSDWFTGRFPGSPARGELYNDDPRLGDARQCGTTASLCGIESAGESGDAEAMARAVRCDLMLHAWMLTQSGIPVIYSGDEVAQLNDYGYRDDPDPDRAADSRYVHRGCFDWSRAALRSDLSTPQGQVFSGLRAMTKLRAEEAAFGADARVRALDAGSDAVLGVERSLAGEALTALFNFSDAPQSARLEEPGRDLLTGAALPAGEIELPPYGFVWCKRELAD